jgi:hypothetical protein
MAERLTVRTTCPYCGVTSHHVDPWCISHTRSGLPIYSRRVLGVTGNPLNGGKQGKTAPGGSRFVVKEKA